MMVMQSFGCGSESAVDDPTSTTDGKADQATASPYPKSGVYVLSKGDHPVFTRIELWLTPDKYMSPRYERTFACPDDQAPCPTQQGYYAFFVDSWSGRYFDFYPNGGGHYGPERYTFANHNDSLYFQYYTNDFMLVLDPTIKPSNHE
jgi:hypothetical protein